MRIPNELIAAFKAVRGDKLPVNFDESCLRQISTEIIAERARQQIAEAAAERSREEAEHAKLVEKQQQMKDLYARIGVGAGAALVIGMGMGMGIIGVLPGSIDLKAMMSRQGLGSSSLNKKRLQKVVAGGKKLPSQPSVKP